MTVRGVDINPLRRIPCCPTCGQKVLQRAGIDLTPCEIQIYDLIEKYPGISSVRLAQILYPEHPTATRRYIITQHVFNMNSKLCETTRRIYGKQYKGYRIVQDAS